MLTILEHELQNRVGIQHDVTDNDGAIWLRATALCPGEVAGACAALSPALLTRPPAAISTAVATRTMTRGC